MNDIERRLRELGAQVDDGTRPRTSLQPRTLRRIRLRRIAAMATSIAMVVALGAAGTFVTGAWSGQERVDPAEGDEVTFARYMPHFSADHFAVIEINVEEETVCYSVDSLPQPSSVSQVAIFEHDQDAVASSSDKFLELVPNVAHFSPSEGDDCVGSLSRDALVAIVEDPAAYLLLVDYGGLGLPLTARLTAGPPGGRCARAVDFEPTYLPDGWIEDLQPGEGGGGAFRGIVGHYGSAARAGTHEKARAGFADLIARERPYQQGNVEDIQVLGSSATLGDIHEGYSVEFTHNACEYFLIAFGIAREELRRFAEGLARSDTTDPEPSDEEDFGAIWPEDTAEEAEDACADGISSSTRTFRHDPMSTALEFGDAVLGWDDAIGIDRQQSRYGSTIELRRSQSDAGKNADGPVVWAFTSELIPGCWSVVSVSRPPDDRPTGVSVSIRRRDVEIGFNDLGAHSVYFQMGHGSYMISHDSEPADGRITALLTYKPDQTGHFLLLFKDENGEVFSAAGGPLPAGNFAAG